MATAGESVQMDLDDTLGPFLIGTLLALFLQGATLYQEVVFFANCNKAREPWGYILLVAGVTVCDLLHSAFAINTIWLWIVVSFGNPSILALSPWSFTAEPVMTGLMALTVHLFYAHRVWLVSEKSFSGSLVAGVVAVLTLMQFAFSAAVTGKIIAFDREFVRFADWLWGACVWLGLAAAVDLIICLGYFYWLGVVSKQMAGPFERSTRSFIKVGMIILATNGLSASVAVIATVLFGVLENTNYHAIAQLCLSKFLALSLLVALNARNLLADLLGVEAGYFSSYGVKTSSVKQRPSGIPLGAAGSARDGIYGRAASLAGFSSLQCGDLANQHRDAAGVKSKPDLAVRGVGGVVYPISMPGLGDAALSDEPPRSLSSIDKDLQVGLDDALEHVTYSRLVEICFRPPLALSQRSGQADRS